MLRAQSYTRQKSEQSDRNETCAAQEATDEVCSPTTAQDGRSSRRDSRYSTLTRVLATTGLVLLATLLAWSYVEGGIVWAILTSEYSADEKLSLLRGFFAHFGSAAPLAYLLFVTIEVIVAPIPGTMLYAPGGIIFGGFQGGILSLAGNVIGAAVACQLVRI